MKIIPFVIVIFLQLSSAMKGKALWGGGGGGDFDDESAYPKSAAAYLSRIRICHGSMIDSIEFFWYDNGYVSQSGRHGGSGGHCEYLYLSQNDCIKQVDIRAGSLIDGLTFIKNDGTAHSYGGNGGGRYSYSLGSTCLMGAKGKSGSMLDNIETFHGKVVSSAQTPLITGTDFLGGNGGGYFRDSIPDESASQFRWYLHKIQVRSGSVIDGIQGVVKHRDTGEERYLGWHGGHGGGYHEFVIQPDECISSVDVRYGTLVDKLIFHFKYNKQGAKYFGGNGGAINSKTFGAGCLIGFKGQSGSLLDSIGFLYTGSTNINGFVSGPTNGIWRELATGQNIAFSMTVGTSNSQEQSVSSSVTNSWSIEVSASLTLGFEGAETSVGITQGIENSYTTESGSSWGFTQDESTTITATCSGTAVGNGTWKLFQWTLYKGDASNPSLNNRTNHFFCVNDSTLAPRCPYGKCQDTQCQTCKA